MRLLIDGYRVRGEPIPEQYFMPELLPEASVYLTAFCSLEYDRPLGFGCFGAIQFAAIDKYADRLGIIRKDEFWLFERMIRICDDVWLKHHNASRDGEQWQTAGGMLETPEQFSGLFG